jgi:hypothetical protein
MAAPVTSATFESVSADIVLCLLYLLQGKKSILLSDDIAFYASRHWWRTIWARFA